MNKLVWFALLLLIGCPLGCGREASPTNAMTPLAVEDWKAMAAEEKFSFQTMERLKVGNPRFQNDAEWDRFARTVFVPAQRRELPVSLSKK